jgi:hypothetical protein
MMDETHDDKPHVHVHEPTEVAAVKDEGLSIWFFCGILTLAYGFVLIGQALCEHFRILDQQPPTTVLANLHPTFWWGILMTLFGAFYTIRFWPKRKLL